MITLNAIPLQNMKTTRDCQDPSALFNRKLLSVRSNISGSGAEKNH